MATEKLTRRSFLVVGASVAAAGIVAACGSTPVPTPVPATATKPPAPTNTTAPAAAAPTATKPPAAAATATTAPAAAATATTAPAATAKFKEAPMFADLVKAGKLPPVEQRLPANPLVIKPFEKVGKYGGTWRTALKGGQDDAWMTRCVGYDFPVRWDLNWTTTVMNVAESITPNADASEFTMKLRKGMKWSDGNPFTADDVVFYFMDIMNNKDLTVTPPAMYTAQGKPCTATKVDELTASIKFAAPNGLFLVRLATPNDGGWPVQAQAKYAKQFHKNYQDAAKLDAMVKEAKVDDWIKLFQSKITSVPGTPQNARFGNINLPLLNATVLLTPSNTKDPCKTQRNPYYWKVDTEGNQLPYIDGVLFDYIEDLNVLALKAANGEIDLMDRHIATNQNKPVFVDNMKKGDYSFFETIPSSMNDMIVALNLTCQNKQLRAIFQDLNFRAGLSHAINRKELIDVIWVGQGEPYQLGPRPTSPYYNEKLAKQYTEFDIKKANEYLDKVLPKKDASGMRLMPDGKPISFTFEITNTSAERSNAGPMISKYFKAVGVDMIAKVEDRAIMYQHKGANEFEAMCWGGDGGLDVILEPRWYFPYSDESQYGIAWQYWYNKDPRGEEPPAAPKKQMELYDQLKATGDTKKQDELMKQILQISQEQFYAIGITLPTNGYGILKNNFKNVPKIMPGAWLYPNPGPAAPEQFYFDK